MARRTWRIVALTLGLSMTLLGSGLLYLGVRESGQAAADLDQQLTTASQSSSVLLSEFFDRAVGSDLQLASEPAFANFYAVPGGLKSKVERNIRSLQNAQTSLMLDRETYPGAVSEACFIDLDDRTRAGPRRRRARSPPWTTCPRRVARRPSSRRPRSSRSTSRTSRSPTSPRTPASGSSPPRPRSRWTARPWALAHFEVSIESLRQALVAAETRQPDPRRRLALRGRDHRRESAAGA